MLLGAILGFVAPVRAANAQPTYEVLHAFVTSGSFPSAPLVQASDGDFYGTTESDNLGKGTIFKITAAGALTTLHWFDCPTEGCSPTAGLIQVSDGDLYGTTSAGGAFDHGTVFKITRAGVMTTLHSFDCSSTSLCPGVGFRGGLIQASDGDLYGTTDDGGATDEGTVFKITTTGVFTTLHSFDCSTEGRKPLAGLIQASDGALYGTTNAGGANNQGTVFRITTAGIVTTLHSLDCSTEACGFGPNASLIQARDGDLYGTSRGGGGARGDGAVFKITTAGAYTTLFSFDCTGNPAACGPDGGLIEASDSNLYGTTEKFGTSGNATGTVFKITKAGALTILHVFPKGCGGPEGCHPLAGLIQATDGDLYGTTLGGSIFGGTVFKITTAGALTTLSSFGNCPPSTEGCLPKAGLTQASDGALYGTTDLGGANNDGTVFKITTAGVVTTLRSFDCSTEGCRPLAWIIRERTVGTVRRATTGRSRAWAGTRHLDGASNLPTQRLVTAGPAGWTWPSGPRPWRW